MPPPDRQPLFGSTRVDLTSVANVGRTFIDSLSNWFPFQRGRNGICALHLYRSLYMPLSWEDNCISSATHITHDHASSPILLLSHPLPIRLRSQSNWYYVSPKDIACVILVSSLK